MLSHCLAFHHFLAVPQWSGEGGEIRDLYRGQFVHSLPAWNGRAAALCPWFSVTLKGLEAKRGEGIPGFTVLLQTAPITGAGAFPFL